MGSPDIYGGIELLFDELVQERNDEHQEEDQSESER